MTRWYLQVELPDDGPARARLHYQNEGGVRRPLRWWTAPTREAAQLLAMAAVMPLPPLHPTHWFTPRST